MVQYTNMVPTSIHTLEYGRYRWINVTSTIKATLAYLKETFDFEEADLKDCSPTLQRPKVVPRQKYLFVIFVFPVLNQKTQAFEHHEVDLFIGKNYIITVHNSKVRELNDFFKTLTDDKKTQRELMPYPSFFISQIIDELLDSCFPQLQHLSANIDHLRRHAIGERKNQTMVYEILKLKNEIVAFRKTMQPHQALLRRILKALPRHARITADAQHSFDRLIDHTNEIWDHLEIYRDAIDAVEDTNSTLTSYQLNQTVKTLTIFSVILLSLTFCANLFIMEGASRPLLYRVAFDWWIIIGVMAVITLIVIGIFKKKRWL